MNLPVRPRRRRATPGRRRLFRESSVEPRQLIQPYFIVPGSDVQREVRAGFGLWQLSAERLVAELAPLAERGLGGVMLFGVPDVKRERPDVAQLESLLGAVEATRRALPELPVFADVCLCSYTTHGHCGLVRDGRILNDESVEVLSAMAVALAKAGVDYVCPSDMMDGRVAAIRAALDGQALTDTGIVSYAVKMASAFYGPFREAADSAPAFGDRRSYQLPVDNRREALHELALDEAEAADVLLIKPALSNLDLIRDARERTDVPLVAYQVSGEYAMLRAAADAGLLDFERASDEALRSIRRAGADAIVTYAARQLLLRGPSARE